MSYSIFNQEVAERKAATSGARHRKNGSKSRKYTMPSDNLTPAQKRKLNGEVVTMNLYKPMEFRDFTKMSTESQREYIQHLRDVLKASKSDIQHMFDISEYQMNAVCRTLGVGPFSRGGKKNTERTVAWHEFLSGNMRPTSEAKPDFTPAPALYRSVQMKSGQLTFSGNLQEICRTLQAILGQDAVMDTLEVSFKVAEGVSK